MKNYHDDGLDDVPEYDLKDELSHKMRTAGGLIAYRTAVAICEDPKATAAAKASALNSLFRAGGFFAPQDPNAGNGKDEVEMTVEELRAASKRAHDALAELDALAERDSIAANEPSKRKAATSLDCKKPGLFD